MGFWVCLFYMVTGDGEVIVALCELFSICIIMFTPMDFGDKERKAEQHFS